jgi:hypothetical protein
LKVSLSYPISLIILLGVTPANAHCYSRWYYPHPQPGCGGIYKRVGLKHDLVYRRVNPVLEDPRDWTVEITKMPALTEDELRQRAIEQLKGNK